MELLMLGSEGSGKSFLIRKIKEYFENASNQNSKSDSRHNESDSTDILKSEYVKPTVGVDLVTIESPKININKLKLREVGSPMLNKWASYYSECDAIILVVDISDSGSFASSYILLLEILSHQNDIAKDTSSSSKKSIILACNKLDIATEESLSIFLNIIRFDELKKMPLTDITVMKGSCLDNHLEKLNLVTCIIELIQNFQKS